MMSITTDLEKFIRFVPVLYRYKDRKSIFRICQELIRLALLNRAIPDYYFTRHLYRKEVTNIKDYLPNKYLYRASLALNDLHAAHVLKNKLFFDLFFGRHMQQLPRVIMYNHQKMFYAGDEPVNINSPGSLEELLKETISSKAPNQSLFVKKTYDSYGGKNTYRFTLEDFPLGKVQLNELYANITRTSFLFQEMIIQHPQLNRLNPDCINSIRMDTFIDREGHCELMSAYIRMSIDGSYVDNVSSGGCYVGIDLDSGELREEGYSSITIAGGAILKVHPVTGVAFKGFKIPHFEEVKKMVLDAARLVPGLRLIGWDVAIAEAGPVLIEGNCGYDITGNDLVSGGYKSNPVFRKVLEELDHDLRK